MSIRRIPLWDTAGRPTPFLMAQWQRRGARQALAHALVLVERGSPTSLFRGSWKAAFPSRPPLPDDIATPEGLGTGSFWLVFG